jgi:zinc protease
MKAHLIRRLFDMAVLGVAFAACSPTPPLSPASSPAEPAAVTSAPPPAAAEPPPRVTPDAPFRDQPPLAGPAVTWVPPRIDTWTLKNGVHVLFIERHDLPIVSVRVVSGVGAGDLAGLRPGTAAFMGSMLEQGAGTRSALALSDDYETMGADHAAWCDWDTCVASVKVLASHLGGALDLVSDVVLRPTFPGAEIDRLRKRWLASIQQERNSPPTIEQNALAAAVFGRAHPYGHSLRGQAGDVQQLTRADVQRAWRSAFQPGTTTLLVAGDVASDSLHSALEAHFGSWRGGSSARIPVPVAPADRKATRVVLVDVPGAAQSQVYVGQEGAPFASADRIPLGIMNLVLGGMFSSRINLELREAKAYTYGAHSGFSLRHGAGAFAAGGAMFAEHTSEAARELIAQVERMRAEPVTAEELDNAKENAKLALPARFESVDELTGVLEDIAVYKLPLDEFARRAARIDAVTAADVQRVAKKWLKPERMRIVVTGDRAKVAPGLVELGTLELRDAYGDLTK